MFLFTKPKAEAGKGYLRIEKNLWLYDPATGRWERRTERERIGGTNTRRGDLDESRLVAEYDAKWEGDEKLGVYAVHKLLLTAKPGVDVAFPVVRLWVDQATLNILKRQELALSGRLMRTVYQPRWRKIFSPSKKGGRLVPGGDPDLRRDREGELDPHPHQGDRPAAARGEPVHEGVARVAQPVRAMDRRAAVAASSPRSPPRRRSPRRTAPPRRSSSARRPSRPRARRRPRPRRAPGSPTRASARPSPGSAPRRPSCSARRARRTRSRRRRRGSSRASATTRSGSAASSTCAAA